MSRPRMQVGSLALALLLPWPALADGELPSANRGELLYRVHCRSCHGEDATGDGPMAELLKVKPADLTLLAEGSEGEFEPDQVDRKIDGRDQVRGHGGSEMPIWGLSFQSSGLDSDQEHDVRKRIEDLVAYLASLQRTDEDTVRD